MIESAVKAMFTVGTEGVTEMFLEPDKWSNTFKVISREHQLSKLTNHHRISLDCALKLIQKRELLQLIC